MDKTQSDREETEESKAMSEQSKSEIIDKYKDIAVHFSKVEWAELCEWEKIRFKNVKRNYEAMLEIGFNVPKPEFMSRRSRGSQPRVYESSDSDEDWTPKPLVKNPPQMRIFKSPFKSEDTKKTKKESTRKTQKARSQMASHSEEDKAENRRYSLRNRERTVYTEERELGDDDYLFCEDCETFFIEECSVHGPPVFIKDTVVEVGQPDRARLTVPEGLSIAVSKIRNAGLGVWNEGQVIPKAIHFGPYEGTVSNEEAEAASGYSWVISKSNKDVEYIDAKDESTSNWMRFVNCARNEEEQNLVAFQHCGQIYYRTCKPVPPRCELLVWYGDEYAEELGIKWPTMSVAKQEPTSGQRVLRDDSHPCPHCSVAFATADFLHKHIRRHLEFSGQTSAGAFHLDQQIHTGERPHQCTDCGQSFAQAGSLRTHQRIHTGERPYKCSQCGQSFAQAGNLQTHQRIHTGERPYKCSQCGQSFAQAGHLQTHQRMHTGERPFKCLECGQSFARAGNLQRHQRIHTGERPFKCLECGQSFARTGHLQTHQRVHTGERPYKCSQCGQSFARTGHLQTHQRVHTGERPYKCSQCGKSFVYSYQLKAHTCFETCRHCGNVFNDSTAYKVHMRNCMET